MTAPVISVCIANYNGMALIDACIESVLRQDVILPVEIIVHDDASTDGSAAYIRQRYPSVKLIEGTTNAGFCVANNRMAAVAQGKYLLLLNNDATLLPDALGQLLQEAGSIGHAAILTLPQYDADTGVLLDMGCRLDPFLNPVPNLDPASSEVGTVHGACMWIDKLLWDRLRGFPEWFSSVGEDLYLCCCARLAGYPVKALGISGYRHRVGQSFGGGKLQQGRLSSTIRRRALSERNKNFVMAIAYPAPVMQMVLPLHLLLLLFEGTLLSILKRNMMYLRQIYWPAILAVLGERNRICKARKSAQEGRPAGADFFSAFDLFPYKLRMLLRYGLPRVK